VRESGGERLPRVAKLTHLGTFSATAKSLEPMRGR